MRHITAAKAVVVAVAAVLIAGGAIGMYLYTPPLPTASSLSSSTGGSNAPSGSASQSVAPPCGYQDSSGRPHGCWTDYLGYLPAGYVVAPRYTNGPVFPCPPGMPAGQCKQFRASCGNGVCDPNESCGTCLIDCLAPGQTCNAYTGRAGSPTGICQVVLNATG